MGAIIILIVYIGILVTVIAGVWKAFAKAGQPGWASLIPIYNIYVMTQIAKKPGWWVLLMFIPIVSIVVMFMLMISIAKNFGKEAGFGVGLALLGLIFWPILGFGDAVYAGVDKAEDMEVLDA